MTSSRAETEAIDLFKNLKIAPADALLPPRHGIPMGKTGTAKNMLKTNVYPLRFGSESVQRYHVQITTKRGKGTIEWSARARDDYITVDRREHCRLALTLFMKEHPGVLKSDSLYYDLQSLLFSPRALNLGKPDYSVSGMDFNNRLITYDIKFSMIDAISLSQFTNLSRNLDLSTRDIQQFIDIATAKYALDTPEEHVTFSASSTYLLNQGKWGFGDNDVERYDEVGGYLAIGASKNTHTIEDAGGKKSLGLVISVKKTPFHSPDVSLKDKIDQMAFSIQGARQQIYPPYSQHVMARLNEQLKGLYIYTTHLLPKQGENYVEGAPIRMDYVIRRVISEDATKRKFQDADGVETTVAKYFKNHYNITLRSPDYPLVESLGRNRQKIHLPVELCRVCDNQRLKTSQMVSTVTQKMIRKCAVPPSILYGQNINAASSFNFPSGFLRPVGIEVAKHPMEVKSAVIPPPGLVDGNLQSVVVPEQHRGCTWNLRRFFANGTMPGQIWVAYAFLQQRDRFTENELRSFCDRFVDAAKQRGLNLNQPTDVGLSNDCTVDQMRQALEVAVGNGTHFALCIHGDPNPFSDQMHAAIKLAERDHELITQCVKLGTVRNVLQKGQRQTMENIINKTNMKLGGLNYTLQLRNAEKIYPEALIIGISSNNPGAGFGMQTDEEKSEVQSDESPDTVVGPPTVVGFASNVGMSKKPFDFVGDFMYQPLRREEKADVIQGIIQYCLLAFKHVRGSVPRHIILFRNGCSEGSFKFILKYEIPLIKRSLEEFFGNTMDRLTVIAVNRLKSVTFFKKNIPKDARPPDQNIEPGTIVDTDVTSPEITEFYLNSHRALQGTAKTAKYTVVYNENRFEIQQLERMAYDLCYCHQIVFMPTSLPSPVYIANRYSERGRMLYNQFSQRQSAPVTFEELNQHLPYSNSGMQSQRRINA